MGFVGHEHHVRGELCPVHVQEAGGLFDEFVRLFRDVLRLEAHGMGRAVGHFCGHDVGKRADASCACRLGLFQDEGYGATSQNHSVAAFPEWDGRAVEFLFGGCCSDGQEASADPGHHFRRCDAFRSDHDDSFASAGVDPVLCDADGGGGRCAGGIHEQVGTGGVEQFRDVGMSESQDLQKDCFRNPFALSDLFHQFYQTIVSRERRGHDDAGLGSYLFGKFPPGGQRFAAGKRLFVFHQRKPRVRDGLVGCSNSHPRRIVPALVPLARHGVVFS